MEYNLGIGSRIRHSKFGAGVVINVRSNGYTVTFIDHGMKEIPAGEEIEVLDEIVPETDMVSMYDIERTLKAILRRWSDIGEDVPMHERWQGGKIILIPGKSGLQQKELPIDQLFNKIVMTRDRLRVMEQKINASKLTDEEKIYLQQSITRIYGSLTTFNQLFKYPHDHFVGEKSQG